MYTHIKMYEHNIVEYGSTMLLESSNEVILKKQGTKKTQQTP